LQVLAETRQLRKTEALVVMASGLGKTVLAAFDALAYLEDGGRVLYLCHQNEILKQARRTFEQVLGSRFSYASLYGNSKDLSTIHKATCLFTSFQTMREWQYVFPKGSFDYIIVDEGHHVQAPTYKTTLEYFVSDFLLGLTATPDRGDLQDIRSIYGEEIYSLPLEEALARGLLTPVKYVLLSPMIGNLEELRQEAPDLTVKELDRRLFAPQSDAEVVRTINERSAHVQDARTMIFCPSIEYCERLAISLPGSAPIHSGLARPVQDERLEQFRSGEVSTVLTVDKFNEGLDIPEANVIVFLRSTASRTIFLQQLGRGLRRAEGKEEVLALDFVGNCQRLEMVHSLWSGAAAAQKRLAPDEQMSKGPRAASFDVEGGLVEFSGSIQDIVDVIKTAGTSPNTEEHSQGLYTQERLINELKVLAVELDRVPTSGDILIANQAGRSASMSTYIYHFGSYRLAVEAAGLPWKRRGRPPAHTKGELLVQFRELMEDLERIPTVEDITQAKRSGRDIVSYATFRNYFGSITAVIDEINLEQLTREVETT
jgi:superfamily II DNA or RNA helicase